MCCYAAIHINAVRQLCILCCHAPAFMLLVLRTRCSWSSLSSTANFCCCCFFVLFVALFFPDHHKNEGQEANGEEEYSKCEALTYKMWRAEFSMKVVLVICHEGVLFRGSITLLNKMCNNLLLGCYTKPSNQVGDCVILKLGSDSQQSNNVRRRSWWFTVL